jgi:hypothetical protein
MAAHRGFTHRRVEGDDLFRRLPARRRACHLPRVDVGRRSRIFASHLDRSNAVLSAADCFSTDCDASSSKSNAFSPAQSGRRTGLQQRGRRTAEDVQEGVGGGRAQGNGVDPRWRKGSYKDLSTECQQRLRDINLHWHDPRHEYTSRLVERGVPLAQVPDLLGHASILTTEHYDNQNLEALQAAVERLEGGKTFDPKIEPSDKVSRIFQDRTEQSLTEREDPAKESVTGH